MRRLAVIAALLACGSGKPKEKPPLAIAWHGTQFRITNLDSVSGTLSAEGDKVVVTFSDPDHETQAIRVGSRGFGMPTGRNELVPGELVGDAPISGTAKIKIRVPLTIVVDDQRQPTSTVELEIAPPRGTDVFAAPIAFAGETAASGPRSAFVLGSDARVVGPATTFHDIDLVATIARAPDFSSQTCQFTAGNVRVDFHDATVTLRDRHSGAVVKTGIAARRTKCPEQLRIEQHASTADLDPSIEAVDAWIAAQL